MLKIKIFICVSLIISGIFISALAFSKPEIQEKDLKAWQTVLEFNTYIKAQAYPQAYEYLSIDLQNKINIVEFMEVFYHFDLEYGQEVQLIQGRVLDSEKVNQKNLELVSVRNAQVMYAFGLEKQFDEAYKIVSFKFFVPQDKWARVYE